MGRTFAERLTELREKKGWSMYRLAQVSQLSKQTLSHLEAGDNEPTWETVQRLAAALGVSTELFRGEIVLPEPAAIRSPGRPPKPAPAGAAEPAPKKRKPSRRRAE